jgi:hypothetical protein
MRVCFALVAAAGEIATVLLITGWNKREAFDAASKSRLIRWPTTARSPGPSSSGKRLSER